MFLVMVSLRHGFSLPTSAPASSLMWRGAVKPPAAMTARWACSGPEGSSVCGAQRRSPGWVLTMKWQWIRTPPASLSPPLKLATAARASAMSGSLVPCESDSGWVFHSCLLACPGLRDQSEEPPRSWPSPCFPHPHPWVRVSLLLP